MAAETVYPLVWSPSKNAWEKYQAGDNMAGVEEQVWNLTNGNAGTLIPGTPVYNSAASTVDKAQANALATSKCIGLVDSSTATGAQAPVQFGGIHTRTTAEWDAIAGTTGGLTAGQIYYLDNAVIGKLTATPPSTPGTTYLFPIIRALSTVDALMIMDGGLYPVLN